MCMKLNDLCCPHVYHQAIISAEDERCEVSSETKQRITDDFPKQSDKLAISSIRSMMISDE